MDLQTHRHVKDPCWLMGGRAPFHMFDARCELGEVSIKCSDVGLGEVCLALVIDVVGCISTVPLACARLVVTCVCTIDAQ
jgi:hypothetical protein